MAGDEDIAATKTKKNPALAERGRDFALPRGQLLFNQQ
jgi:hypothetical protein